MTASHIEFLVEEPSMEELLRALLPRLLPKNRTFGIHAFQGKRDLLGKLEDRLRGYARWLPNDWRIVVVVDRDNDDCRHLKKQMEDIATRAGLISKSRSGGNPWQLVNRIAIEELEAWYFGDWDAVRAAYPRVSDGVPRQRRYRNPDAIAGGTWEAFERVMQRHGYFRSGLVKIEAARTIGAHIDPKRSRSRSFQIFCSVIMEVVQRPS